MLNKDPYNKVILTDCDGVLLNWGYAFSIYMQQQGEEKREEDGERKGETRLEGDKW